MIIDISELQMPKARYRHERDRMRQVRSDHLRSPQFRIKKHEGCDANGSSANRSQRYRDSQNDPDKDGKKVRYLFAQAEQLSASPDNALAQKDRARRNYERNSK